MPHSFSIQVPSSRVVRGSVSIIQAFSWSCCEPLKPRAPPWSPKRALPSIPSSSHSRCHVRTVSSSRERTRRSPRGSSRHPATPARSHDGPHDGRPTRPEPTRPSLATVLRPGTRVGSYVRWNSGRDAWQVVFSDSGRFGVYFNLGSASLSLSTGQQSPFGPRSRAKPVGLLTGRSGSAENRPRIRSPLVANDAAAVRTRFLAGSPGAASGSAIPSRPLPGSRSPSRYPGGFTHAPPPSFIPTGAQAAVSGAMYLHRYGAHQGAARFHWRRLASVAARWGRTC